MAKDRFAELINNIIDIACDAANKTISRGEVIEFTQLNFVTGASLMTLQATKFKDISGLSVKKIWVIINTTTIDALKN